VLTRTVTGNYLTATGSAAKGRITFTPTSRVIDENNAVIVEDPISATLDSSGAFTVALPTTDNPVLNPTGWAYEVVVRLHGLKPHKFFAFLPYGDGSSVNLNNDISTQPAVITHSPFAQFQVSTEESGAPQVWPSDVITRNVTGTYLTATGAAAQGRVTFTPTARVIDENDSIIIEDTITATLNASGAFTVALPTTDNPLLTPENWAYEVNVRIYGVRPRKFYILLPYGDGTDVDIINSVSTISSTVQDSTIQPSLLRGPVGPRGPGTIIGSGAPANSTGFDGDIYIDSDTGEYYGPKADGIWPTPAIFSIADVAGFNQRYIHTQTVAASTWSISHPLGGRPSVTIVDTGNTVVVGDIVYNSDTSVTVSFTTPFSGYAYLT
jgi:hypothetical protein